MKLLAFESSAKAASVAILEQERLLGEVYQNSGQTHSRTLLKMAEDLLCNCGLEVADLDAVAVAAGPGSFTGVRIGMAAAKGLCWGAELPLYGVSTLESMARFYGQTESAVFAAMDARRSQVYNALFERKSGALCRISPDRAISLSELLDEARTFQKPFFFIGDGAELSYKYFSENGLFARIADENIRLQTAWGVAVESLTGNFCDPGDIKPNYLRLSQAERERLEKLKKEK